MAQTIKTTGSYNVKTTGEEIQFDFEFVNYATIAEAIAEIGEIDVLALVNRMSKVDAGNTAREKAKSDNGHSTRAVLTEEQKAKNKAQRQADKSLLAMLKAKGLSVEDLARL